jgi:hypothetical protein
LLFHKNAPKFQFHNQIQIFCKAAEEEEEEEEEEAEGTSGNIRQMPVMGVMHLSASLFLCCWTQSLDSHSFARNSSATASINSSVFKYSLLDILHSNMYSCQE